MDCSKFFMRIISHCLPKCPRAFKRGTKNSIQPTLPQWNTFGKESSCKKSWKVCWDCWATLPDELHHANVQASDSGWYGLLFLTNSICFLKVVFIWIKNYYWSRILFGSAWLWFFYTTSNYTVYFNLIERILNKAYFILALLRSENWY